MREKGKDNELIKESPYGFFKNILIISTLTLLIRIFTDLYLLHGDPYGYYESKYESDFILIGVIAEYVIMLLFFAVNLFERQNKTCRLIIKIWLVSYLVTTIIWAVIADIVRLLIYNKGAGIGGCMEIAPPIQETYMVFSSLVISLAIYHTGKALASHTLKLTGILYLPVTLFVVCGGRLYLTKEYYPAVQLDIISYLCNIQYIIWLFIILIQIRGGSEDHA